MIQSCSEEVQKWSLRKHNSSRVTAEQGKKNLKSYESQVWDNRKSEAGAGE